MILSSGIIVGVIIKFNLDRNKIQPWQWKVSTRSRIRSRSTRPSWTQPRKFKDGSDITQVSHHKREEGHI